MGGGDNSLATVHSDFDLKKSPYALFIGLIDRHVLH